MEKNEPALETVESSHRCKGSSWPQSMRDLERFMKIQYKRIHLVVGQREIIGKKTEAGLISS